uniref:Uncharacterized protein n=1 Tax=Glossina austeni TaxID=7395 RepID=A0A1A9UR79_GLOAU
MCCANESIKEYLYRRYKVSFFHDVWRYCKKRPFECRQLRNMESTDICNFYQNDLWGYTDGSEKRLRVDAKVNMGIESSNSSRISTCFTLSNFVDLLTFNSVRDR